MMTMITVTEYLRFMGAHMTKKSNQCMEQSVTFSYPKLARHLNNLFVQFSTSSALADGNDTKTLQTMWFQLF